MNLYNTYAECHREFSKGKNCLLKLSKITFLFHLRYELTIALMLKNGGYGQAPSIVTFSLLPDAPVSDPAPLVCSDVPVQDAVPASQTPIYPKKVPHFSAETVMLCISVYWNYCIASTLRPL